MYLRIEFADDPRPNDEHVLRMLGDSIAERFDLYTLKTTIVEED